MASLWPQMLVAALLCYAAESSASTKCSVQCPPISGRVRLTTGATQQMHKVTLAAPAAPGECPVEFIAKVRQRLQIASAHRLTFTQIPGSNPPIFVVRPAASLKVSTPLWRTFCTVLIFCVLSHWHCALCFRLPLSRRNSCAAPSSVALSPPSRAALAAALL